MKRIFITCLVLCLAALSGYAQPANDICANAITLPISSAWTATSNVGTVVNGPHPGCGGNSNIKDVWFSFVYPGGTVTIETQLGTNTDTRIALYTACGGTVLACNDDIPGSYASRIVLSCTTLTIGNTYKIQAGGYNSVVGTFSIRVTATGVQGCTNPLAINYSPCAGVDDGSCTFNALNANFSYTSAGSNCLNLQFTSTSTGNVVGYSWSFPGGTPATSTLANPVVSYSATGTYSATLTVSDPNSSTSTYTNSNIQVISGNIITIDITPDGNPSQTSWKLFDSNNAVVLQGTTNDATICLPPNSCHRFEIYDTGNNGLSGLGNYKIYENGVLTQSGQTFASLDIRPVNCPDGVSCNQPIQANFGVNAVPFDNTWFSFTPAYSGQYKISTCNLAPCDTKIWIYDYCVMANFDNSSEATFTYNDDFCGVQAQSDIYLAGGSTYYVRVGSTGACSGQSYGCLFEFVGTVTGCMDVMACNYNPLAGQPGPCYYNGDPNCSGLGPDLALDLNVMYNSLVSTTINSSNACLINEGCLQGTGTRQILRFTTRITNIGTEDYFIGVPNANNPQFEYDACHNHYHYEGYAEYLLYDSNGQPLPYIGFKNGFCVLDLSCPPGITAQYGCGNMGITAGCADIYSSGLDCQWIDITSVPAGSYYLVTRTNWDQSPDALGNYELRYDNNIAYVCISFERDASNNIINFTKNILNCSAFHDCVGTPFGDEHPDCENNCPGIVITGDVNEDGYFTAADEHVYGEAAVNGGISVSPCTDLNGDNEITVADAAYAANCLHYNQEMGVPPLLYRACDYDPEFLEQNETAIIGITNLNTTLQYFDVYMINAQNEVIAFQIEIGGVVISSVQNLLPASTWAAHLHHETNGNAIAAFSGGDSEIPIQVSPTPVLRVYYSSLSGNEICITNIIDVLNDLRHNILVGYGNCATVVPPPVADFYAEPSTTICAGQSIDFFDASSGNITSWNWSFPGGTPASSNDQNPSVDYLVQGTYTVTLTVSGPTGTDTETKSNYIVVGNSIAWYIDNDGDGYGTNQSTAFTCVQPAGYTTLGGDCNDNSPAINPGATEVCNGSDDDCDGLIDEGFDMDNDGYTTCQGDCDDNNALRFPGAFELCNGIDEDCDGQIDEGFDNDNDGYKICQGDCNDSNAQINPGAAEICNNVDDDCDGLTDEGFDLDNDGYTTCEGDCNDNAAAINPGATEICNNLDDNCDGNVDEGFDLDNDGYTTCDGDCNDGNSAINPDAVEECNGQDDDCDGLLDENCCEPLASIGNIEGPIGVCRNQTGVVFAVAPVAGATAYVWTLPAGASGISTTNSISLSFSSTYNTGQLCVKAINSCDESQTSCMSVQVFLTVPNTPGAINGGNTDACPGTSRIYSIAPVSNATSYLWTAPTNATITAGQGTTTVEVTFAANFGSSGILQVRAVNCKGNSALRTLTVYGKPATPGNVTGPTTAVCGGTTQSYSIAAVNGATGYTWAASAGAIIASGQGTTSVTVTFPSNYISGAITVTANSSCGASNPRTIYITSVPPLPASVTGQVTNLCGGGNFTYTVPAVAGAISYNWTPPAGCSIIANTGTSITLSIPSNFVNGNLCYTITNACGTSSMRCNALSALPPTPVSINGSASVCVNATGLVYSTTQVSNFTYTWTVPADCAIVSGQGTNTITVNWGDVAGNILVKAQNTCGFSSNKSKSIAVVTCFSQSNEQPDQDNELATAGELKLTLFPNPNDGYVLNLRTNDTWGEYVNLKITDALGRIVCQKQLAAQNQSQMQWVFEQPLTSGIYLVELTGDNRRLTERLLIER